MTHDPQPPDMDFEELYNNGTAVVPWDIGEPQPALAELVSTGWCTGTILDVGCGTGELGLALAARGHPVTGVDLAPSAVELARHKATERGLNVDFRVADATELDGYDGHFDTVLDSGLLHCLAPTSQHRYIDVLRRVCRIGGGVAILCFADVPGARAPDLGRLSERWLRELFTESWEFEALEATHILGVIPDGLGDMSEWPRDERGRTAMTGWRLRARRVGTADTPAR